MELNRVLDHAPDLRDFPEIPEGTAHREALAEALSLMAEMTRVRCDVQGRGVYLILQVLRLGSPYFVHLLVEDYPEGRNEFQRGVSSLLPWEVAPLVAQCMGLPVSEFTLNRKVGKLMRYLKGLGLPLPPRGLAREICAHNGFRYREKLDGVLCFYAGPRLIFGTPLGWWVAGDEEGVFKAVCKVWRERSGRRVRRALRELGCPLPRKPTKQDIENALAFLALAGKVQPVNL